MPLGIAQHRVCRTPEDVPKVELAGAHKDQLHELLEGNQNRRKYLGIVYTVRCGNLLLVPFSDPNIPAVHPEPPVGCGQKVSIAPRAPLDSEVGVKEKRICPDALRFCSQLHEFLLLLVVSLQVQIPGNWGHSHLSKTLAAPFLDTSAEQK